MGVPLRRKPSLLSEAMEKTRGGRPFAGHTVENVRSDLQRSWRRRWLWCLGVSLALGLFVALAVVVGWDLP